MSSVLEKWIEVNQNLFKCYEAVKPDSFDKMAAADQGKLCANERKAVQTMLSSHDLDFATIAKERLSHL